MLLNFPCLLLARLILLLQTFLEKNEKKKKIYIKTTPNVSESETCLLSAQKNKHGNKLSTEFVSFTDQLKGKDFLQNESRIIVGHPLPPKKPTPQNEMLIPPETVLRVFKTIS